MSSRNSDRNLRSRSSKLKHTCKFAEGVTIDSSLLLSAKLAVDVCQTRFWYLIYLNNLFKKNGAMHFETRSYILDLIYTEKND